MDQGAVLTTMPQLHSNWPSLIITEKFLRVRQVISYILCMQMLFQGLRKHSRAFFPFISIFVLYLCYNKYCFSSSFHWLESNCQSSTSNFLLIIFSHTHIPSLSLRFSNFLASNKPHSNGSPFPSNAVNIAIYCHSSALYCNRGNLASKFQ